MKNKLKIPHDAHVETVELKVVVQEKQALENELQDTKAIVGTFQNQKEGLKIIFKSSKMKLSKHHTPIIIFLLPMN